MKDVEAYDLPFWYSFALILGVIVAAALFTGCPEPGPRPPMPLPPYDGGYLETPCGKACARLDALGCPESRPNKAGQRCEATCEDGIADGLLPVTIVDCVGQAADVEAVRKCRIRCQ